MRSQAFPRLLLAVLSLTTVVGASDAAADDARERGVEKAIERSEAAERRTAERQAEVAREPNREHHTTEPRESRSVRVGTGSSSGQELFERNLQIARIVSERLRQQSEAQQREDRKGDRRLDVGDGLSIGGHFCCEVNVRIEF